MQRTHRLRVAQLGWSLVIAALVLAACASGPKSDGAERPFIKLAARGLGLWVVPGPNVDARAVEELDLYLATELRRLYQTEPSRLRGPGSVTPLQTSHLYALGEARADDVVIIEPRMLPSGLGARVSVLTVADEQVVLRFEIQPRSGEAGGPERLARRIADRLGAQFNDPGAGAPLDTFAVADRLARRGACAQAVSLYDRDLPQGTEAKVSVAVAAKEYEHRAHLERCRNQLALAARRVADRTAHFGVTYDLDQVDPSFHALIKELAREVRFEAELQKLTDKPATFEVSKNVLMLHLRYHPERYKRSVGSARSAHKGQPAIYFEHWLPALRAVSKLAQRLVESIPGTAPETYLRLTTLEGDWLEIGFARVGTMGEIRVSEKLRVHQVGIEQDTMVDATAPRDLRSLIFTLGPPRTLDGKPTIYGPPVEFLGL